jgi:hypothetical protein
LADLPTGPFTFAEMARIRELLGFPGIFHDSEPRLEYAFQSLNGLQDGYATQQRVRVWLDKLQNLDDQIDALTCDFAESAIGGAVTVKTDAIRAVLGLELLGRKYIQRICFAIGTWKVRDYYSVGETRDINSQSFIFDNE